MNGNDIIALGLGLCAPWEITGQTLDTEKTPYELRLTIAARRVLPLSGMWRFLPGA